MLKNVTLSAEEALIQKARRRAADENKSLNAIFRDWLARYVHQTERMQGYRHLMKRLRHVRSGRTFSRDEMNER